MQPNQDKKPQQGGDQQVNRPNPQVIQAGVGGVFLAMGKALIVVLLVVLILKFGFGINF